MAAASIHAEARGDFLSTQAALGHYDHDVGVCDGPTKVQMSRGAHSGPRYPCVKVRRPVFPFVVTKAVIPLSLPAGRLALAVDGRQALYAITQDPAAIEGVTVQSVSHAITHAMVISQKAAQPRHTTRQAHWLRVSRGKSSAGREELTGRGRGTTQGELAW